MSYDKKADTVVPDIEAMLQELIDGKDIEITDEKLVKFGSDIALTLKRALTARKKGSRKHKVLYMSEYGRPCRRQLWYELREEYHTDKEQLKPANIVKFLYGDILEEIVLLLAELSGHTVEDQQRGVEINLPNGWLLRGRIDAIIDGEVVDVKSTTTHGFKKFKEDKLHEDDPFGYIPQLAGYGEGIYGEDIKDGQSCSFLAIDKQLGNIVRMPIYAEVPDDEETIERRHNELEQHRIELVEDMEATAPPERAFDATPDGKSGNMKLRTSCSYCPFKHECWKESNDGAGLRTFIYSTGPRYLTEVAKTPNVPEKESEK